jgi:hypothetical protein
MPGSFSAAISDILAELLHGFPESLQANAWIIPRSDENRFLPNPFQFIIQLPPYHPTLYSIGAATESAMKQTSAKMMYRLVTKRTNSYLLNG